MEPTRTAVPASGTSAIAEALGARRYGIALDSSPADVRICKLPAIGISEGLTKRTRVDHPPPVAKWGKTTGCVDAKAGDAMGSVVIRNSERSLTRLRRTMA